MVKTQKAFVEEGSNAIELNVSSLALKVTCNGNRESAVSKFVKE